MVGTAGEPGPIHVARSHSGFAVAVDEPGFLQAVAECRYPINCIDRGRGIQETNHRYRRSLRACRERPYRGCAAEQRDELASSEVEHGLLPGTRCASLPQAQDAPEAPAGPWGKPEMF